MTRRELASGLLLPAVGALALGRPDSIVNGVILGCHTWCFRDMPLDQAIKAMRETGLKYCELGHRHVEPWPSPRAELRKWRLTVPMDFFKTIRRQFDDAGIELYAYNLNISSDFSDDELARGFEMADALGLKRMTSTSRVSMTRRIDAFASRAKTIVGLHNHSLIKPDEFATPESFEEALRGASAYIGVNLDVGHFSAAGFNPLEYIEKWHDRMVTIHLRDRKKDQGLVTRCGEGDTPIREIVQLLRHRKSRVPVMVETEYREGAPADEPRRYYELCRKFLEAS